MATVVDKAGNGPSSAADNAMDSDSFVVVPSDTALLNAPINAVHVGSAGDVAYVTPLGVSRKLVGCLAGQQYHLEAIKILATGTTVTNGNLTAIVSKALR